MTTYTADKVFKINDFIVSKVSSTGISFVASLEENGQIFRVDGIASTVWNMVKQKENLGTITQTLQEKFPNHQDQLKKDIDDFIKKLIDLKIIEA